MTKQEVTKLIFIIKATYPKYYAGIAAEEIKFLIDAWAAIFAKYDYEIAAAGLQAYIANDVKGFPPTPGQIIDRVVKTASSTEPTAAESWAHVYKKICKASWHAAEGFAELSEIEQRIVGSPEQLKQWALASIENGELSVIQSQYIKAYDAAIALRREEIKLPGAVRDLLTTAAGGKNLLTGV